MTIQENTNDLQSALSIAQENLAKANALPDAGGSGGGDTIDTCTIVLRGVDIDTVEGVLCGYSATAYVDGAIRPLVHYSPNNLFGSGGLTMESATILENVVCGSVLTVMASKTIDTVAINGLGGDGRFDGEKPKGAELLVMDTQTMKSVSLLAPAQPGAIAQYSLTHD